jgi:hypothetical protein
LSSVPTLGKIFSMTGGFPLRIVTFALLQDRIRPVFRSLRKSLSNRVERKSFLPDFFTTEIRTCRKNSKERKAPVTTKLLNPKGFSHSDPFGASAGPHPLPFRTSRKSNSYQSDFFLGSIRTCWNFIRTRRKRRAEIIEELSLNSRSINTFLFISRK